MPTANANLKETDRTGQESQGGRIIVMKSQQPVALVTGANKGIGLSTAWHLLRMGYRVYLAARNESRGEAAVRELNSKGLYNVVMIPMDVADEESVNKAAEFFGSREERLDVLINNAATGGQKLSASSVPVGDLKEVFETNYFGVVNVTHAFLPFMRRSHAPRIVNVSSELGSLGFQSQSSDYFAKHLMAYSASKVALNSFTVMLAKELENTPFKINSVSPGLTATDLTDHSGGRTPDEAAAIIVQCATLPEKGPTGQFFGGGGRVPW